MSHLYSSSVTSTKINFVHTLQNISCMTLLFLYHFISPFITGYLWLDCLVFSDKDQKTVHSGPRLTALSMFITLWDLNEPTHHSQRVGYRVTGVVVCALWYIMVARVNTRRYYLHQAALKSKGKERYMIYGMSAPVRVDHMLLVWSLSACCSQWGTVRQISPIIRCSSKVMSRTATLFCLS